jgi:hypothetical protein
MEGRLRWSYYLLRARADQAVSAQLVLSRRIARAFTIKA